MTRPAWLPALALAVSAVLVAPDAGANGRSPSTSTIHFERGNEQNIAAGMTFGLLLSSDGGATWQWMCEAAVGYGGTYDPSYAYSHSGAIFATTFDGLKVNRNGCTFDAIPATTCSSPTHCTFVSVDTTDGSDDFFYAAADPKDSQIYKSVDDGSSFLAPPADPGQPNDWWESLQTAPSNNARVYATGYRTMNGVPKVFLLFRSDDGGSNFVPMAGGSNLTTIESSIIDIADIDPNDPDTMYVTVNPQAITQETTDAGIVENAVYGLWKTTDGGAHFTQILTSDSQHTNDLKIAFVARKDGDLVAGTQVDGAQVSHDKGSSWEPLAGSPHINCLTENGSGEVWACTLNYGTKVLPSDDAGIMKTTDLATWTKVLRYQDIAGPVECPDAQFGSNAQQDQCIADEWCTLKTTLLITSTEVDCALPADGAPVDAPPVKLGGGGGGGCCDGAGGGSVPGVLAVSMLVAMIVLRRRDGTARQAR
jgi:photosystem II stability/assembly factor-like uncharacterized protein|nr:hypothetical protein [Kofleriaceae bacterium]